VSYVGNDPLPDTFIDKSQALVEGSLDAQWKFCAERVQAKCASKYEAARRADPPRERRARRAMLCRGVRCKRLGTACRCRDEIANF